MVLEVEERRKRLISRGGMENEEQSARPISRRGVHYQHSALSKEKDNSRTSSSNILTRNNSNMRPGSAYRGGTASRLINNTNTGAPPPTATSMMRIGTAALANFNMVDRPITQQGLSGLRTGTGMTRQRQLRDRRYWEEELGTRIRSLRTEIERLHKVTDAAQREKSANKHYEARGRELAQELTDLQGRLADYNLASQMMTAADITAIQKQSNELEDTNNKKSNDLERVFAERQHKEGQLRQILEQIKKEQGTVDSLVSEMTPTEKSQYVQLKDATTNVQEEIDSARMQISQLSKARNDLEKQISMSQMKAHMVDLIRKLMTSEERRDALKEEMNNKMQPAQEREQLLTQVRDDNTAIASMESNSQSIKDEIKRSQDLLEQAEQDLEEGQSQRHQKYRELKKREETMEIFIESFEQNMKEEKDKITQLESDIVFAMEHCSSNIDQLNFNEIDSLRQRDGGYSSLSGSESDRGKSADNLVKEYTRLETQLKKAKETRERIASEMITLPEKISTLRQTIDQLSDLDTLKTNGASKKRQLIEEASALKDKLAPTESAVEEANKKYRQLQKRLDGNEMYAQLNAMEEKLATIETSNAALREDIASITIKTDYEPVKKQVFDVLETINDKLKVAATSHVY